MLRSSRYELGMVDSVVVSDANEFESFCSKEHHGEKPLGCRCMVVRGLGHDDVCILLLHRVWI